jgi:uncharacterized spore protein YtfJ
MEEIKELLVAMGQHLEELARSSAVVAEPISVGERHVIPLCELSLVYGAGGGMGESGGDDTKPAKTGIGGAAGGGVKACPVAVLVIDGGRVRLETIGDANGTR